MSTRCGTIFRVYNGSPCRMNLAVSDECARCNSDALKGVDKSLLVFLLPRRVCLQARGSRLDAIGLYHFHSVEGCLCVFNT